MLSERSIRQGKITSGRTLKIKQISMELWDEWEMISPPGATIAETAEERGMTPRELADGLALTFGELWALLYGQLSLTAELAGRLQQLLGIDVEFWMAREALYRSKLAELEAKCRQN